jgi:plasmid stability protein
MWCHSWFHWFHGLPHHLGSVERGYPHGGEGVAGPTRQRTRFDTPPAQIKVRLPEALRWNLEREASAHGHSMNAEIVRRLRDSFLAQHDRTTLVAEALLESLDDNVIAKMADIVMRSREEDELGYMGQDALDEQRTEEDMERGGKK